MTNNTEGVIKYQLQHTQGELDEWIDTCFLDEGFVRCREANLLGQDPARYDGYAYGNISQRAFQGFVVSGTQRTGKLKLERDDYCWVKRYDFDNHALEALGPCEPSSESITHAKIYALRDDIAFIIHAHSPEIWQVAEALGIPVTDPAAAYGTPEMAQEVERIMNDDELRAKGIFAMGGHQDGIVSFDGLSRVATQRLLDLLEETRLAEQS
jgi:hypothetical protein